MAINLNAVGVSSDPHIAQWTSKDCLLYALGVGAGMQDPTGHELEFTTENSKGVTQRVLPTFAVVLPSGGGAFAALGDVNMANLVHGEQAVTLHQPLPVEGKASVVTTIKAIYDKGSAAVVEMETVGRDIASDEPIYTTVGKAFIRGEGGFGGDRGPSGKIEFPDREADHTVVCQTRTDQALLYRLSGDRNPLHSDPAFAATAGFDKPILHGLCTFGFTGRALLHSLCGSDPERFTTMSGRFSLPVMPGQDLTVSIWETGDGHALFRTSTDSGVVLDAGEFSFQS